VPDDQQECIWCDRAWALLGLLAGAGIAFMAIDLLGGGFLTRSLTRRLRISATNKRAASAFPPQCGPDRVSNVPATAEGRQ